jgi:hypothetical protein
LPSFSMAMFHRPVPSVRHAELASLPPCTSPALAWPSPSAGARSCPVLQRPSRASTPKAAL